VQCEVGRDARRHVTGTCLALFGPPWHPVRMTDFAALVDQFLDEEFEASPTMGSALGLTQYDDKLDDLSAEALQKRDADAERWLDRFSAVPDSDLEADDQIDRDLVISVLRGRTILADWQNWRRDPLTYTLPPINS